MEPVLACLTCTIYIYTACRQIWARGLERTRAVWLSSIPFCILPFFNSGYSYLAKLPLLRPVIFFSVYYFCSSIILHSCKVVQSLQPSSFQKLLNKFVSKQLMFILLPHPRSVFVPPKILTSIFLSWMSNFCWVLWLGIHISHLKTSPGRMPRLVLSSINFISPKFNCSPNILAVLINVL